MKLKTLNVGIAGYGIVGRRRHKSIKKVKNFKVIAVCDRKFKKVKKYKNILQFTHYKKLLTQKIDVLFICLTNDVAAKVTIEAIKKGIHVFCEKPPGRNVEDIDNVYKVYKKTKNIKLMYGFNHRHHLSIKKAIQIIKSKKFGKIINIKGIYGKSQLITFKQPVWRTKRKIAGGGVLLDQGIHMIDLIRLFAGEFDKVYSYVSNSYWKYDVEDNAYALMKAKNGIIAILHSSATQWNHKFELDIHLEKGSLILRGSLTSSKSYGNETLLVVKANPKKDNGNPKEKKIKFNKDPSWDDEIKEFYQSITSNKKVYNGHPVDALNTMKLLYKIYYSDINWRKKYKIKKPNI